MVKDEVVITFDTSRERDDVRSFAKNLERKGKGLRLEVPDHLWPSFRVLQEVAYELKQKHASLRRNILFDDVNMDLKMDFTVDSVTWKTLSPEDARQSIKRCRPGRTRRVSVSAVELDSLLGKGGPEPESESEDMEEEY